MGPFDRFNDRAKRVFALAQDEAIRLNHNYIGMEHLLLGLIREGEGVAARSLDSLGVDLSKARTTVEFLVGRGKGTTAPSEITLHPRTKRVVELAIDEARKLGHSHVGTEHLVLGLVREGESEAAGVLQSLGVELEKVRHQVIATLGQQPQSDTGAAWVGGQGRPAYANTRWAPIGPFDRLDTGAGQILARAYWEAGRSNSPHIGPEHLLLALIADDSAWMRCIWTELGVHLENLVALISAAPRQESAKPAKLIPVADLSDAIDRASSFAAERHSALIRPEHLLLGIVAGPKGVVVDTLAAIGVTSERVRTVVDKLRQ
jgi:ATP-dependent Clp protease ATP-binding subunit ClpA